LATFKAVIFKGNKQVKADGTSNIKLGDSREYMNVSDIKIQLLDGKSSGNEIDFFDFTADYIKTVKVKGTADQFIALVASLKIFNGERLPFTDATLNFLMCYEIFLCRCNLGNGISNYMRTFRALFNKCQEQYKDDDTGKLLIAHYRIQKYVFPKSTTDAHDHTLTLDEMKRLIEYNTANCGEAFARDMFLLMIYIIVRFY